MKVLGVIVVGLLLVGGWLIIDHLMGPDCGDFLGYSYSKQQAETSKILNRSGLGSENAADWIPEMERYCRSNRGDHLEEIEASHEWGWGW